jgi:hypothetical protein
MKILIMLIIIIAVLTAILIPISKGDIMKGFCEECGKLSFSLTYENGKGLCKDCKPETNIKVFIGCRQCNEIHRCCCETEAGYNNCEECFIEGDFCEEREIALIRCYAGLCPVCSKQIFMEIARRDYGRDLRQMCEIL